VRWAAEPASHHLTQLGYFALGLLTWAIALCSPLSQGGGVDTCIERCVTGKTGQGYTYQALDSLDTDGIRYDEVAKLKGYPIDVYINPYRNCQFPLCAPSRGHVFFGEPAPTKPTAVDAASETIDHNAAVISTALPVDQLPVEQFILV